MLGSSLPLSATPSIITKVNPLSQISKSQPSEATSMKFGQDCNSRARGQTEVRDQDKDDEIVDQWHKENGKPEDKPGKNDIASNVLNESRQNQLDMSVVSSHQPQDLSAEDLEQVQKEQLNKSSGSGLSQQLFKRN
jgi:hypothetical protein